MDYETRGFVARVALPDMNLALEVPGPFYLQRQRLIAWTLTFKTAVS